MVDVIDREEIEAAGAETIAAVLETHPGIEVEPGLRGFTIRMQGLDPEYVLILVDGERAQGRLGGGLDLTRFPADAVERVEIVKGAGSALYGSDAVAGVINIITRRPKEAVEVGGHLSGGSIGALDASAPSGPAPAQLRGARHRGAPPRRRLGSQSQHPRHHRQRVPDQRRYPHRWLVGDRHPAHRRQGRIRAPTSGRDRQQRRWRHLRPPDPVRAGLADGRARLALRRRQPPAPHRPLQFLRGPVPVRPARLSMRSISCKRPRSIPPASAPSTIWCSTRGTS